MEYSIIGQKCFTEISVKNILQLNHVADCIFLCAFVREAEWGLFKICVFKLMLTLALAYVITIYNWTVYIFLVYSNPFVFSSMEPHCSSTE